MCEQNNAPLAQKRHYHRWVANETLEDFALRYTAKSARKYSIARVANTALGVVSFLALEAIGTAITLQFGFINAVIAIAIACSLIFLIGLPICYQAAKNGLDIDLLTRGAGFGYVGSTLSSLIYAAFTFIFFALEAAIMATAVSLLLDLPLSISYNISALLIIPLATHGIKRISTFQLISQPLWLTLQLTVIVFIFFSDHTAITQWTHFNGVSSNQTINLTAITAACAIIFPLMAQNGEQVDYLRFLPEKNRRPFSWWLAVILAGPGWVIIGAIKLLLGSFLGVLAIQQGFTIEQASEPTQLYRLVVNDMIGHHTISLIIVCLFVILSQIKINVTNAYAGSIAWSNFFSRITHHHPGRVVWMIFNVVIALILMELGLYKAFEYILTHYSILVLSWLGTLTADLTINISLKLRPTDIRFMRNQLFDINPVGCCSMLLATIVGFIAQSGFLGSLMASLAPFLALFIPFLSAPALAALTQGRFYHVRENHHSHDAHCCLCEISFESQDMHHCPFYSAPICSLCCSLDVACNDHCRPESTLKAQWYQLALRSKHFSSLLLTYPSLWNFLSIFIFIACLFYGIFSVVLIDHPSASLIPTDAFGQIYILLLLVVGIFIWLYVLANESRRRAYHASANQTTRLKAEIDAHKRTEVLLAQEKEKAEEANMAKTRYLGGISHELRTPLNTLYGYTQLMEQDPDLPEDLLPKVRAISQNTEHITSIIEGLLEISRIEARQVDIMHKSVFSLDALLEYMIDIFQPQAQAKGLLFKTVWPDKLPSFVESDEKRIKQILTNLLSNAIKYTIQGQVTLSMHYRNQVAHFSIQDTGIGIAKHHINNIFDPFKRLNVVNTPGTGLGLSITKLLTELLGGDIHIESKEGVGSTFYFSLFLPSKLIEKAYEPVPDNFSPMDKKKLLLLDDEVDHLVVLSAFLSPLGFHIDMAETAETAISQLDHTRYDACILDIRLPGINGWAFAHIVKQRHPNTQIIILSGDAMKHHKDNLYLNIHNAYLTKPVNFDHLKRTLNQCLDNNLLVTTKPHHMESLTWDTWLQALKRSADIGHVKEIDALLQQASQGAIINEIKLQQLKQLRRSFDYLGIQRWVETQVNEK